MDSDLTADSVRSQSFSGALRGYDRDEVDAFRNRLATRLSALESELAEAASKLQQLGIDDVPQLEHELARVGSDVTAILEEARRAATEMRQRAAADAAALRTSAEADVAQLRTEAQQAAEHVRGDAWLQSTDLLDLAGEEAERIVAAGRQEVLFVRAEAEREVMRLTGEARREAEDLMRGTRAESDRIVAAADAEAETIVTEARRAVEATLERTRTLEQRKAELDEEIEAARLTLEAFRRGGVEAQRVVHPGQEAPPVSWEEDEAGGVKIVAPGPAQLAGPVDADEMMAEVQQLRSERAVGEAQESVPVEGEIQAAVSPTEPILATADTPIEDAAPGAEDAEDAAEGDHGVESELVATATEAQPDAGTGDLVAEEDESRAEVEKSGEDADTEPLAGLFAQLRQPAKAETVAGGDAPAADEKAPSTEVPAQPPPDEAPPSPLPPAPPPSLGEGAFELRDRLLLPIENGALRAVKRHLVELQNRVLEELRTSGGSWTPDPDEFLTEMGNDIAVMREGAFAAGVAAAAELTGLDVALSTPPGSSATREFAQSLISAVETGYDAAAQHDAGSRELASAVSRVFRAWRTDEAERRLRHAAYAAYHDGLLAGFAASGVAAVTAVTLGRPCPECPAGVEWAPGSSLPDGLALPPARLGCVTTIVPAGMAG